MATYAIGDIHGCYQTLCRLLARLQFAPARDRLWLVGDLVNRGPDSLGVLRWAYRLSSELAERMVVVLGNHDLHLLAVAANINAPRGQDDFAAILAASDAQDLLAWLARRPLLYREDPFLLVHAGLLPSWTLEEATDWARRLERQLLIPAGPRALLARRPQVPPSGETAALRQALGALTRLRMLTLAGQPCDFSGSPAAAPADCVPWFKVPGQDRPGTTVIFGHWAALGFYREPGILALDSGCAWGGPLSAVRLEDGQLFQQPRCD